MQPSDTPSFEYNPQVSQPSKPLPNPRLGAAWLLLGGAFSLHLWDEAAHQFLGYYNATMLALYGHFPWFPRLDMNFRGWLGTLILGNLCFLALAPWAFRNVPWLRPLGYFFAALALLESLGQLLLTMRGHTSGSVHFDGASPGFYTAPLLFVFSVYLIRNLRRSAARR